jgi:hypothetical protein
MKKERKGITVAHALPGRVRLKIPRVKQNRELARQAQEKLIQVQGIERVEANPLTGSLLIIYNLAALATLEALGPLGEALTELFPEEEVVGLAEGLAELTETGFSATATGGLHQVLGSAGQRASSLSRNLNLRLLLPLTFLFLGVRSLFASKEVHFPAWYDFLWFGFASFVMLNRRWVEGTPESAPVP